jgi:hypothetical protein
MPAIPQRNLVLGASDHLEEAGREQSAALGGCVFVGTDKKRMMRTAPSLWTGGDPAWMPMCEIRL